MPNYTTNYNLTKPLGSELYSIDVQNDNMDKIDDNLNRIENRFVNQNYAVNSAKKYTITGKGVDTRETLFTCDGENEDEIRSLYGKTVTVSFDYETAITDGSCDVMIENVGQTVATFNSSSPSSGHSSTTVTLEDYTGDLNKLHLLYLQGNFSGTFTITKVKIELGNKETEWCKAVQDHFAGGTSSGGGGSTSDTIDLGTGKVNGVLPIANGGTGNANGRAISAESADKASKLTTSRTIQTNLGSPSAASFDGSTNIEPGVTGVLPTANGGTGNTSGRAASAASADKATKLATARTIKTNLSSTSGASFDGSANATPGVSGVLPIGNGGTGAENADGACANIGAVKKSGDTMTGALFVEECIYGNSVASRLTGDSKRFALMYSGRDAAVLQSNDANWSGKNWLALHDDHTSLHKPLDVGSGGTGATNAATACDNIGAVKKSGDTMTGALAAPAFQVKGTDDGWDGIDIVRSSDGGYRGGITSMGAQNNLVLRERSTNGGTEYYKLPIPSAPEDAWYNILTDKTPVTVAQGGTNSNTRAGAVDNLVNAGGVDDANTANDIGMYTYGNTTANVPYTGWGTIFTFRGNQPWLNQIAITTDNPPHIFYRTNINGAGWGSWLEFYTKGNVVYSSSQPAVIDGGIWLKPV